MSTPRQEIKFGLEIVSSIYLDKFLQENSFNELYQPRHIYSTYCDTILDSFLEANIEGHDYRKKLRLRHYQYTHINEQLLEGQVQLEEKSKYLYSTIKKKTPVSEDLYNISLVYDPVYMMKVPVTIPSQALCPGLVPRSIVAYRRRYYSDEKVRITIDDHIRFSEIDKFTRRASDFLKLKSAIILEVKSGIHTDLNNYEKLLLSIDSVERTKVSKYVASRAFFEPEIDSFYPEFTRYGHATESNL